MGSSMFKGFVDGANYDVFKGEEYGLKESVTGAVKKKLSQKPKKTKKKN